MIKIERGKNNPKMLAKTSSEFKKAVSGMSIEEAYDFYNQNKNRYQYNTSETKRIFKKINHERCSFCTKHISEFDTAMTVEHIKIKRDYPSKIFEWRNLLCACHTCNTKRATKAFDAKRYLDPTKTEDVDRFFTYRLSGKIAPSDKLSDEEKEQAQYMIDLYDLNWETLKSERKRFMEDLMQDEEFYNILKQMKENSPNIIFLSLFTYYKGVYE